MTPATLALKWSHSVVQEDNFLCEAGAREQALKLAMDLGIPDMHCHRPQLPPSVPRRQSHRSGLHVGFAPELELRIGDEDCGRFHGFSFPTSFFACGLTPWSGCQKIADMKRQSNSSGSFSVLDVRSNSNPELHNPFLSAEQFPAIFQCKVSDNFYNVPSRGIEQDQPVPDPDVIPDIANAPPFARDLQTIADHHGVFTDLDSDGAFRIRTWYLHHHDLLVNFHSRIIELEEDWRRWEDDIVGAWRDHLQAGTSIFFHLASPDPPRDYMRSPAFADVIITQGNEVPRKANIVTVRYHGITATPHSYAVAVSVEPLVSGWGLTVAADALQWCSQPTHDCSIWHGWVNIPFDQTPNHVAQNGHTFVIGVSQRPATEDALSVPSQPTPSAHQGLPPAGSHRPENEDSSSLFQLAACTDLAWKARLAPGHETQSRLAGEQQRSAFPAPQGRERTCRFVPGDYERLQRLFTSDSFVECEEEGHVAYIDTWFIHHVQHRVCPESRAVRLQEDPSDWLTDIIQTWDPLLLPEEDIVVRLVRPQPPCTRFQCVLAHLIVEQSSAPDYVAGIISTWQPEDFVTPLRHSAFSLFHLLNHQAVLNIAGLRDVCRRTTCNVRLGELPFGLFDWEPVEPGRCLVVHVRPISTAASSSDNFEDWNSLLQLTDIQVDETSLMARRPFFRRPSSSSPSYTSSSTSSTPDWRQTVIFLLDGRTMSANLPWHDSTEMLRLTAQAADLPLSLVMRTHMISHRPPDFIQMDLQGLLLQQSTEFRPTPYLRLVLLDLELHLANDVQPTPFVRRARWLPFATSRQALFRTLGLAAVHQEHRTQCHLWQNNVLIDPRDETQLHLADGDYLKIFVGDAEQNDDCISAEDDIIDVSDHTVTSSSDTDVSVFLQRQLTEFRQSCDHCHHHLDSVPQRARLHPGLKRHAIDINTASGNCESFTFDATAPAFVPAAERLSNMPTAIQDLYEQWNQVAFAWEDEPRTAQLVTWFVDHGSRDLRTCQHSRTVTLLPHFHVWEQQIRHVWHEFLQPGAPYEIQIVNPSPPNMATDIVAHVILIQHPTDDWCTSLITLFDHNAAGLGPHRQLALTTVEHIYLDNLIHSLGLTDRCLLAASDAICEAWYHQAQLILGRPIQGRNGYGIQMRLRPRSPPAGSTEDVQFLQLNALLVSGSDVRQTPGQVEHANRPPTACTPPNPMSSRSQRPAPRDQSAFVQRLLASCQLAVRSGDLEDRGILVSVFFVNHNIPHARCDNGRLVHLDAHFDTWEEVLREAWRDSLHPTQPLSYYIVSPQPFDMEEGLAAFVILVQDPQPHLATSLVSVYETGHLRGRSAVTTLQTISHSQLVHAMGFQQACIGPLAVFHCEFWTREFRIRDDDPHWSTSGLALYAQLQPIVSTSTTADVDCVRPTNGLVAHTRWPQSTACSDSGSTVAPVKLNLEEHLPHLWFPSQGSDTGQLMDINGFPAIGERREQDWTSSEHVLVKVLHTVDYPESQFIPDFIELPAVYSEHDAASELQAWGLFGRVFLCGDHDAIFVLFADLPNQDNEISLYCGSGIDLETNLILRTSKIRQTEIQHMKFLHLHGVTRAVIKFTEQWGPHLQCLHFDDVQPHQDAPATVPRIRTPWPTQEISHVASEPFILTDLEDDAPTSLLRLDIDELRRFLRDGQETDLLWPDYSILDLPDFIRTALDTCHKLDRIDRYVIYTDGSSQTGHRHRPPEWIALHDISDSWAFAVFAEKYAEHPDQPSQIQFLGFQCHQVLYEEQAPHHIGTSKTGSDAAETEALFWAGLWRISQNNNIPTVFVSDSRLVGDQAAGRIGSALLDGPFRHLREVFQTLKAMLPGDGLRIHHTRSHAGDPYNELVDWLAKQEGKSSFYLRRQPVHMPTFGEILRHLWLCVRGQHGLPLLTEHGLDIGGVGLPAEHSVSSAPGSIYCPCSWSSTSFSISCATANVRTFYKGQEGHPGKLAYVREQFRAHHLNFLGLQEARTERGASLTSGVLRLASGCSRGQLGVEIWANLQQPIAWQDQHPLFLERQDFVVVAADPRHLLVRVCNQHLDLWLLAAHAPHSGADELTREQWWNDLNGLVSAHVQNSTIITLIDANATTGARDDVHVFEFDDVDSPNTPWLRNFMTQNWLYAPSTTSCHRGEHGTWLNPATESLHRIDSVLLPIAWQPFCQWSEGLVALDFGHLGDHQATAVQLQWKGHTMKQSSDAPRPAFERTNINHAKLGPLLAAYNAPSWTTDIEEQVNHLNDFLHNALHLQCPRRPSGPKKPFITAEVWALRAHKLRLQRRQKDQRRCDRRVLLSRVFQAWRVSEDQTHSTI